MDAFCLHPDQDELTKENFKGALGEMAENVVVPNLGATVRKAKIAKWLVRPGQSVKKGEVLCELETEKVTFKIEAENEGILLSIDVKVGSVVEVGQVIGQIGAPGEAEVVPSEQGAAEKPERTEDADSRGKTVGKDGTLQQDRIKISPLARKLAAEKGIPVSELTGSGPGGRIVKADVLAYSPASGDIPNADLPKPDAHAHPLKGLGVDIPLTQMRRIIGDRLTESARDVPHVYFSAEVDGCALVEFRSIFKPILAKQNGGSLSYNDLIIKAVSMTILKYPAFNGTLTEDAIRIKPSVDIGLAMAVPAGLIVPVIRNTERLSLGDICLAREELTAKAQEGVLTVDEMTGGSFTVSNLGQFKIDFFTSIINPPETAILSVARMKERPVAIDGQVVVRPTILMGISIDHRVVDGADGARFLEDLKTLLENPFEMCAL
jgi:pyruvate dehydrogenase E2 component (dihydrolipoamide acetyltransferase)